MTIAVVTGLKPGVKGLIQTFDAAPMKECSRIEEDDRADPHQANHRQINAGPFPFHWLRILDRPNPHRDKQER